MKYYETYSNEYKEENINILYKNKNIKPKAVHIGIENNNKKIEVISIFYKIILFFMIIFILKKLISFEYIPKIEGINYLDRCLNSLNKSESISNFIINEHPKITVIIPIYNSQNSIKLSLASILYQNMTNFEIILINDYSNDNSSIIINEMKKFDNRIKIINNHRNMGTLYSRSIGALNAKGKYIFALDNDDLFSNEYIFETIFNIAEKDNYDIVEFKAFAIPSYKPKFSDIKQNYFNFHPNNLVLHQPELSIFPISRNNKYFINDFLVWGKCIKTTLYQKSVNTLGKKRYSINNCWTEDATIIFIIFNLANSYIFVSKYGIFHLSSKITSSFVLSREHKIFTEIYFLEIIIEFLKDIEKNKKLIIYKAYDILDKIKPYKLSEVNKKYLNLVLKKIIDCKYINQNDKENVKKQFREFIN